jgi:integrase
MYLRKKGKKWYYTLVTELADGSKKKMERVGGGTKNEARQAYLEAIQKQDRFGRIAELKNITVKEFMQDWYTNYVMVNLGKNTIDTYRGVLNNHIYPAFGNKKLYQITSIMLQRFLNIKKGTYSRGTLDVFVAVLKKSFQAAVHPYDYLDKNPAEYIHTPRYGDMAVDAHIFSRQQLKTIFEHFGPEHIFYIPMQLSYHTGMRLGECLALKWADVQLKERLLTIDANLYDKDGIAHRFETTKGKKPRTLPFSEKLYTVLKFHHAKQSENKLNYGKYYKEHGFVCTHEDGSPICSSDMRYFGMWCKKNFNAGSFHSFRHTHATMLLEAGLDMDYVSKRLGHASIAITSKTYSHITSKRNKDAQRIIEKTL